MTDDSKLIRHLMNAGAHTSAQYCITEARWVFLCWLFYFITYIIHYWLLNSDDAILTHWRLECIYAAVNWVMNDIQLVIIDLESPSLTSGQFYWFAFTLLPARISNSIHYKAWDEITYPFPNFNSTTGEVWEWMSNFIPHFTWHVITYTYWD